MIISALYSITKERKKSRLLANDVLSHSLWYTNASIRNNVFLLLDGSLLILTVYGLSLILTHHIAGSLLIAVAIILHSCIAVINIIFQAIEHHKVTGERYSEQRYIKFAFNIYKGIAATIFWLGLALNIMFSGFISMKILSPDLDNKLVWLWGSFIALGGLSWLAVVLVQMLCERNYRAKPL